MPESQLQHFYISEQQSVYLLKADDARKHKAWISLCEQQLAQLGYREIEFIGKGAYGFAFAGINNTHDAHVFKFSRITLPQNIQNRLEDEAHILGQVSHFHIPDFIDYQRIGKQGILVMSRAKGDDLEKISLLRGALPITSIMLIAKQLAKIMSYLRQLPAPIVHGDIKPSNLVWNEQTKQLSLIDWGSAVFAQQDAQGEFISSAPMGLIFQDNMQTNARMGDAYYIGEEQLRGELSSPRFDEQGVAATLYSLASGLPSRFGINVITPTSLGLPEEFSQVLNNMLSQNQTLRRQAGDYFIDMMSSKISPLFVDLPRNEITDHIPFHLQTKTKDIETVCYSSRKSFLQEHQIEPNPKKIDDIQMEKYYRHFLVGMGDTEKGFITAVDHLGRYPIVGGISLNWRTNRIYIDSNLSLVDPKFEQGLTQAVSNMVTMARGIHKMGTFKVCFFNAKDTLHIERKDSTQPFLAGEAQQIPFDVSDEPFQEGKSRLHSYFEDGRDPDENLELPNEIIAELWRLNKIHHTGCIIFEVLPHHMKIHNYLRLLNPRKQASFRAGLDRILQYIHKIQGYGVSGFMKLPYKNTREFALITSLADNFYPKNPKAALSKH